MAGASVSMSNRLWPTGLLDRNRNGLGNGLVCFSTTDPIQLEGMAGCLVVGMSHRVWPLALDPNRKPNGVVCFSTTNPTQSELFTGGGGFKSIKEAESSENWELFKCWMLEHNKKYKTQEIMLYRYNVFNETKKCCDDFNRGNHSYTLGLNPFSDLTSKEFARGLLPRPRPMNPKSEEIP